MLEPGDRIDIWVVERALGTGGMGSVYRCHNRTATRILAAVKVLDPSLRHHPEAERRFIREAEILFGLEHPGIVQVRNIRTDLDPPYLEMEFVEGESLETRLRRGSLPFTDSLDLMGQLADAVTYLHGAGVRHRDIKPANLLVKRDGRVKLVDFGLALDTDASRLTQANTTFGTVSYAPPEWIRPDDMDPERWDIYALGVVFWEMLSGEVAFPVSGRGSPRQQAMQVIIAKQGHPPLDPGKDFHDDVRELIRHMTRAEQEKRPATMAEVAERVRGLRPELRRTSGQTLAPAAASNLGHVDTLLERQGRPVRDEWAKRLAATPVPAEPKAMSPGGSEADTVLTQDIPLPRPRGPRPALVAGVAVLAVTIAGFAAGVALWSPSVAPAPALRPVDVAVTGLPIGTPLQLALDGIPARQRESWVYKFGAVAPGDKTLTWVLGHGCAVEACPGEACPAWCGAGSQAIEVAPGTGAQPFYLPLAPPPARPLELALRPEVAGPVTVRVAGYDRRFADPSLVSLPGIAPGRYGLEAEIGSCRSEDRGCQTEGTCPDDCRAWGGSVVIPWGEGTFRLEIPLEPLPEKKVTVATAPPPAARSAPAPAGPPAPAPLVSRAEFARWLASHPDWQRDAAVAARLADEQYLSGWEGTRPPAGTAELPVTHVSWYAARELCKTRGGLAPLDAPPLTWDGDPFVEYRDADGKAAWRDGLGRTSLRVGYGDTVAGAGFRCAR